MARISVLLAALAGLAGSGCGSRPEGAATPAPAGIEPVPRFTLVEGSGVDFTVTNGSPERRYILDSLGTGVCLIDYDRDGLLDLFLVNGSTLEQYRQGSAPGARLYRNQGDWTFRDVTAAAAVEARVWGQGCAVGDVDNDGAPDLFVSAFGPDRLYLNNRDGTFRDGSARSGLADPRWSTSAVFLDIDRDGNLDLFVANYLAFDVDHPPEPAPSAELPVPANYSFLDPNVRLFVGPIGLTPVPDSLFRGNGDGTFGDVSEASGILAAPARFGLGAVAGDLDQDGDSDLYVANDSVPNDLFLNHGDGTFADAGMVSGAAVRDDGAPQASMGVAAADLDGDGLEDLFVTNFSEDYDTVFKNLGKGLFADVTRDLGLAAVSYRDLGWGTALFDADLDGDLDIFMANGHVYVQLQDGSPRGSYRQRNQLLLNQGAAGFKDVTAEAGSGLAPRRSSRGAAFGDLDNDGDVDIVVTHVDDGVSLLRNDTPAAGHWLEVQLEGSGKSCRDAYAARVRLVAGGRTQVREARAGYSFLSSSDPRLHFGLGPADRADTLEVRWPDGRLESFASLPADRILKVVEGGGAPLELPRAAATGASGATAVAVAAATPLPASTPAPQASTLGAATEALGLPVAARLARAAELVRSGHIEDAIRWYEAVLAGDPGNVDVHLTIAKIAYPKGEIALAERHLQAAVAAAPERAEARVQYAFYLINAKRIPEAEKELETALRLAPGDVFGHYLHGIALAELNRHADAIAEFDRALAGADRRAKALHQKALSLIKLERTEEAVAALREALREEPDLQGAIYTMQLLEARTGRDLGLTPDERSRLDLDRSQDATRQESIVRMAPGNSAERIKLALLYELGGRDTDAARELRTVVKSDPDNIRALVTLARVLGRNGLAEEAEERLAQADRLSPGAVAVRVERARLLAAQGKTGAAATELIAALGADPDHLEATEELARLLVAASGAAADPRPLRWARRAQKLGSKDVVTLARALARAGEAAELGALLDRELPIADAPTRKKLRELQEGLARPR